MPAAFVLGVSSNDISPGCPMPDCAYHVLADAKAYDRVIPCNRVAFVQDVRGPRRHEAIRSHHTEPSALALVREFPCRRHVLLTFGVRRKVICAMWGLSDDPVTTRLSDTSTCTHAML